MTAHEAFSDIHTELISPEQKARTELDNFIQNPGLDELAALYRTDGLPDDPAERLVVLENVGAAYWDFRNGAERQVVDWNDAMLGQENSEVWSKIFSAGVKLHMVHNGQLENKSPKYLAVLGGANKAPFDRLRYGLEVTDDFEHVVYLGSSRRVSDAESEKAKDYAPNAKTEYDLGSGAFESLLGARLVHDYTIERNGDIWGTRVYEFERNGVTKTGFVLSTPTTIQGRRATTYDNYKFFADRAELADDPDATVAAVTTGFYVPGQHLPAVQELTLPYGTIVETIGHSAEYSGMQRKPSQLLQETKSAVDAAIRLQVAIAQA